LALQFGLRRDGNREQYVYGTVGMSGWLGKVFELACSSPGFTCRSGVYLAGEGQSGGVVMKVIFDSLGLAELLCVYCKRVRRVFLASGAIFR